MIEESQELPYSFEAETAVLGSILEKPELIENCYLQREMFFYEKHSLIFEFMQYLIDDGEPIDLITIAKVAQDNINLIGGISYLTEIQSSVPSVSNFDFYQKRVRDLYNTREVMRTLRQSLAEGGLHVDPTKYLLGTLSALESLSDAHTTNAGLRRFSEFVPEHESKLKERKEAKGLTGAKSCSYDLNKITGGYQDEDFIVVAARPSMGKSALLLNDGTSIADEYLDKGIKGAVALFSLEMGAVSMLERVICIIGGLDSDKLRTGELSEEDWIKYSMAKHRLEKLPFYINEDAGQTIQGIEQEIKKLKKKYDKVTVIIDFLQLVEVEGKQMDERARVSYVSKRCKRIARRYKCPVIAISAVGRGVEQRQDKRPMMSDLRESGSIESDADIIIFLYRDDYYDKESKRKAIVELIIAKGRTIGTGMVEMIYLKNTNRFLNIDRGQREASK